MRTREKPPCNTYEAAKKEDPALSQVKSKRKNNRRTNSCYAKKNSLAAGSRKKRLRQIWLKCTLSAAVFTLTLTAAAGWQILKTRFSSWEDFSARATTLLLSDADITPKLLLPDSNVSSESKKSDGSKKAFPADDGPGTSDSLESDGTSDSKDLSAAPDSAKTDAAQNAGGSLKSDTPLKSKGRSESDGDMHSKDSSESNVWMYSKNTPESDRLPDSIVSSESFAEPDSFETSDSDLLKQEQIADTTADIEEIEHIASVSDDWNLILVNPWNLIPEDYKINLAPLPNGHFIDQRCYNELMEMLEDCRAAGLSPLICSSYRTQAKQESLFQERIDELTAQGYSQKDAREKAATSVARPGTSEHQAGLAVDLVDSSYQFLNSSQEYTKVQQWLMENSWKYGFILRYPSTKSSLTGIIYEPWHYRYVGKEAAEEIYKRGICLEEYLAEHFK